MWNVFAADLFNEPYKSTWGYGFGATDWDLAAERIGKAVLDVCPRWLIFVGAVGHMSTGCATQCENATTPDEAIASGCVEKIAANTPGIVKAQMTPVRHGCALRPLSESRPRWRNLSDR